MSVILYGIDDEGHVAVGANVWQDLLGDDMGVLVSKGEVGTNFGEGEGGGGCVWTARASSCERS